MPSAHARSSLDSFVPAASVVGKVKIRGHEFAWPFRIDGEELPNLPDMRTCFIEEANKSRQAFPISTDE